MKKKTYPFKLQELPYPENALEPQIDEKTVQIHHGKHFKKYVEELNTLLQEYPNYHSYSLEEIIYHIPMFPTQLRQKIRNNAGGVYNHHLYFGLLIDEKSSAQMRQKDLPIFQRIIIDFGSLENFKNCFKEKGLKQFGSGYTWLVLSKQEQSLQIINTSNQDCVLEKNYFPLLLVDVWEHAYYLKYQNKREEYLNNFFSIIHWENVNDRYESFLKNTH